MAFFLPSARTTVRGFFFSIAALVVAPMILPIQSFTAAALLQPVEEGSPAIGSGPGEWYQSTQAGEMIDSVGNILGIASGGPSDQSNSGDKRIRCAAAGLLKLIEGNLGALIMVVAGIGTVIASAFGAYRAAVSLLAVAIGAFTLRSFVSIFFVDVNYTSCSGTKLQSFMTDRAPG